MGPLVPFIISNEMNLIIALFLGMGFGFILEQAGFSSTKKLVGLFYGYDFTMIRVFMTAAITALIGVLYMDYFGWIDRTELFVVPTYLGATITGGALMGLGFLAAGFCPGTSFLAAAIGKIDGMVFIGGAFLGILFFGEIFPLISDFYYANYLGHITVEESFGIAPDWFALIFAVIAVVVFYVLGIIRKSVQKVKY